MTRASVPSIEYIVTALSYDSSLKKLETLTDDHWETVVVTAVALGLAPLLHYRLSQSEIGLPPPMAMAKLAITRQAHAKRNEGIANQLAEILTVCADQPRSVLVLKGALLASTVYDEPALRPMNDIDLLFRPQDLAAAQAILEELGYVGKHNDANQGPGVTKHLSTYRRTGQDASTPNPFLSAGGDRTVEPHGSLEESWFGLKVDITPGVWDRAIPITLHGRPAYRLSTNDLVLHLAVHATFHLIMGSSVFLQLYDIGRVLKTWPDQVDWAGLLSSAAQVGARPFLYGALFWTRRLYAVPIPSESMQNLEKGCPPDLVAYIQSLDAPEIFNRTQHPPLVTLGQRLRRGLRDRREAARWAGSWPEKWQVWQTALAFHKTDTVQLLTKKVKAQA